MWYVCTHACMQIPVHVEDKGYRIALQAQITLFIHHSVLLSPRCLGPGIPLCH